jgi:hypothetical protein
VLALSQLIDRETTRKVREWGKRCPTDRAAIFLLDVFVSTDQSKLNAS